MEFTRKQVLLFALLFGLLLVFSIAQFPRFALASEEFPTDSDLVETVAPLKAGNSNAQQSDKASEEDEPQTGIELPNDCTSNKVIVSMPVAATKAEQENKDLDSALDQQPTLSKAPSSTSQSSLKNEDSSPSKTTASSTTQASSSLNPSSGYATIATGVYTISSSISNTKVLEVGGGATGNGSPTNIFSYNYTPAQRWYISSAGADTISTLYTLTNVNSNKTLDVLGALKKNGTTIQQYQSNGTAAQKWRFSLLSNGYYRITSALSPNFVLDLSGACLTNGSRIQLYANNGTNAQQWKLSVIKQEAATGFYSIKNVGSNKSMDVTGASIVNGGNIQQYQGNGTLAQTFYLSYNSKTGYYTVTNVGSGTVLDVSGGSGNNGANIQQYTSNGTNAQKWVIQAVGSSFIFRSAISGKTIDVSGGSKNNSANIQQYSYNGTNAQKWKLEAINNWLKNGIYNLVCTNNKNNALAVAGSSLVNGANVQTASLDHSSWGQKFSLYSTDGIFFRITNLNSGKVIDAYGAQLANGTNIQIYAYNDTAAQFWKPVFSGSGIRFVSKLNASFVLDIFGGNKTSGSNIQLYQYNGTAAQKFLLVSTPHDITGGYFTLFNSGLDSSLSVKNNSKENGSQIIYSDHGVSYSQVFQIISAGSGYYYIKNINSDKVIDVDTYSRTKVQQWNKNGGPSMQWEISFNLQTGTYTLLNRMTGLFLSAVNSNASLSSQCVSQFEFFALNHLYDTTMNGIDISSHQAGINLAQVSADFVIVKATQGNWYINRGANYSYSEWGNQALSLGKSLGFYHFAEGNNAVEEARFFVNAISSYTGKAVLILDWEANAVGEGTGYALTWLNTVYSLTGTKPLIYMSNSVVNGFDWSAVANAGYGLWNAAYPNGYSSMGYTPNMALKGGTGAWNSASMYQYTSSGNISGYNGPLDLNVFYGDTAAWNSLASRK